MQTNVRWKRVTKKLIRCRLQGIIKRQQLPLGSRMDIKIQENVASHYGIQSQSILHLRPAVAIPLESGRMELLLQLVEMMMASARHLRLAI